MCASVCASLSLCVCLKSNCEQAKQPVEFGVQVMQCNRVQNCCKSRQQLTDITDICAYIRLVSSYMQTVMLVDCLACHSNSCCQKISYTLCECTRNKNLKSHIKNARKCEGKKKGKKGRQASLSPASLRCTQCCHISRPALTAAAAAPAPSTPTLPLPSPWGWLCCFKWFRFHVHADFMPL